MSNTVITQQPTRFYWLDTLRGIAALSIVLWHWQHFFFDNRIKSEFGQSIDKSLFPLYELFRPFYGQGWRAVEFFFTLSGFIFFWLYAKNISLKKISLKTFIKHRLSRLYPLHFLTLNAVLLLQIIYYEQHGFYFVYHDYSFWTFMGYLTLTFNWFVSHFSFNGPSWSVSVELFLYLLFFAMSYVRLNNWVICILLICVGYLLKLTDLYPIGTGMISFFVGAVAFFIYSFMYNEFSTKANLTITTLIFSISLIYIISTRYIAKQQLPFYFFELYMFPLIVIGISLLETINGPGVGKKVAFIGDLSYSSYLIHFPLQLLFVLITEYLGFDRNIFYLPITLGIFYIVLIILSFLSFHFYEKPLKRYLRGI